MPVKPTQALYVGPSHATGGIPVVVDGTKNVEVEGLEYKICTEAYNSQEQLSFTQKTNIEVLDYIHQQFACKFDQSKADGGDFIVCKLVVRDLHKRDYSGTVKQILDKMQGSKGCRLSTGAMGEPGQPKMDKGGVVHGLGEAVELFGKVEWNDEDEFWDKYHTIAPAVRRGILDFKNGAYLSTNGSSCYFDIAEVEMGNADVYSLAGLKIADTTDMETGKNLIEQAILFPGNTVEELQALRQAYPPTARDIFFIDYMLFDSVPSILAVAKMQGYDAIKVWENDDVGRPSSVFVWAVDKLVPVIINNESNFAFFESIGAVPARELADGGPIEDELPVAETKAATGYDARVEQNLAQMDTVLVDWRAVPIIGLQEVVVNGKVKEMPVFDFPKGYAEAPSIYKNHSNSTPGCELCGKKPIGTFYWIQNDGKKWTMGVGSECIKHFQVKSGKEMQREQKIKEAKDFDLFLRSVCLWLKKEKYTGKDEYYKNSVDYKKRAFGNWSYFFCEKVAGNYSGTISALKVYEKFYPFEYDKALRYELTTSIQKQNPETKKWEVTGRISPEAAQQNVEKQILAWFTRQKPKIVAEMHALYDMLKRQAEFETANYNNAPQQVIKDIYEKRAADFYALCESYMDLPKQHGGQSEMMKQLSEKIHAFIAKYASISPNWDGIEQDEKYTGPDVYELETSAELLGQGIIPQKCWSDWGSGCYSPYTSKEGKEMHDNIMAQINEFMRK